MTVLQNFLCAQIWFGYCATILILVCSFGICVGLAQGTKPPVLSMMSPATSGKMTPKMATVPPLSQGSPSNGLTASGGNSALNATRTSSFAAALRKLAHQAKDPQGIHGFIWEMSCCCCYLYF